MKKLLALLILAAIVFIVLDRHRLYVRDPFAAVYRNDSRQRGFHVYINYANDVLVQRGSELQMEEYLVQNWNRIPGLPAELRCLQGVLCLATADRAPMVPLLGDSRAQMSSRQVTFTDETGATVRVVLR